MCLSFFECEQKHSSVNEEFHRPTTKLINHWKIGITFNLHLVFIRICFSTRLYFSLPGRGYASYVNLFLSKFDVVYNFNYEMAVWFDYLLCNRIFLLRVCGLMVRWWLLKLIWFRFYWEDYYLSIFGKSIVEEQWLRDFLLLLRFLTFSRCNGDETLVNV